MSKRIRVLLISVSCIIVFYIVIGGLLGKSETTTSDKAYKDLGVYSEVLDRIKNDYVTEPNLAKVTDGAIRGLLEALDPYSTYFTPQQYKDYQAEPEGGPAGIGVFVSKRMGFATLVSVLPGSPADRAGVRAGDLLDRVNNLAPRELSAVQIQRLMQGAPGSGITLTVVRETRGEPQKYTMTREVFEYPPVTAKMLDDGAAYLRVPSLNKGKAAEIAAKLKEFEAKGATKIVLDLRDCAGGEVDEAEKIASLFIDKGLVTYIQGQKYPRQDVSVNPEGPVTSLPLAVLINQSTAGAAELVASAVLENKRGQVVGVRSFGVGVVQKLIPIGDGSALLLSVAKYYGPDGKAIEGNGITPSVVQEAENDTIASAEDESQPPAPEQRGGPKDLQLKKALEVLKQGLTKAADAMPPGRPATATRWLAAAA